MVGYEKKRLVSALGFLVAISVGAARADVLVPATTDIWLAGQPSGATVTGFFGTDMAPGNSPIAVAVSPGQALTFSITGYTPVSIDGSCFDSTADAGACYANEFGDSPGPANGISLADLPGGALVGVFVAAGGPSGPTPAALNFTGAGGIGTNFPNLSPSLDQQFFIGDGLTGTGSGAVQQFFAPAGAATLYLSVSDSVGASGNNSGSISVDVASVSSAPEPSSAMSLLMVLAMTAAFLFLARMRNKSSAKAH